MQRRFNYQTSMAASWSLAGALNKWGAIFSFVSCFLINLLWRMKFKTMISTRKISRAKPMPKPKTINALFKCASFIGTLLKKILLLFFIRHWSALLETCWSTQNGISPVSNNLMTLNSRIRKSHKRFLKIILDF